MKGAITRILKMRRPQLVFGDEAGHNDFYVEYLYDRDGVVRLLIRERLKLYVSDRAHAVFRYDQVSKRPANIMVS